MVRLSGRSSHRRSPGQSRQGRVTTADRAAARKAETGRQPASLAAPACDPYPTDHKCETREAFSIRYTPRPTDQTQTERCVPRPTVRNAELRAAFPLLSCCMEPLAGIEPATPSLPCIPDPPPCHPAPSQVAAHRKWRSYGVFAVAPSRPSDRRGPRELLPLAGTPEVPGSPVDIAPDSVGGQLV
jgi:hypothetical protein